MIAWSFSRLQTFEQCPLKFRLSNITKDLKYVETKATREGKRKHKVLEEATQREVALAAGRPAIPIYDDLQHMRPLVKTFVKRHSQVETELELAFRRDWTPCGWFDSDTWFRCIIDLAGLAGPLGSIIDWKSGQVRYKELQLKINNMTALVRWPQLETVTSSFVFIDHMEASPPLSSTRDELELLKQEFEDRSEAIQIAEQRGSWPAQKGWWCKWCDATPGLCPEK